MSTHDLSFFWVLFRQQKFCSVHRRGSRFQKNQNSKNGRYSNFEIVQKRSQSIQTLIGHILSIFFWGKSSAKCTLEGRDLKKFKKKSKKFQFFKNVQKRSQECSNMFRGDFFKNFWPVNPEERNLEKFEKKSKKKLNYYKCPKTFLKVSKNVLKSVQTSPEIIFEVIFPKEKHCSVHTGGSRRRKNSKKWKNFRFFKHARKVSKSVKTCPEVTFSNFSCPVQPGTRNLGKKEGKIEKFLNLV